MANKKNQKKIKIFGILFSGGFKQAGELTKLIRIKTLTK